MNAKNPFSFKLLMITFTAVLLLAMLGSFAGGVVLSAYFSSDAQAAPGLPAVSLPQAEAKPAAQEADILAAYENALSDIYAATLPSVVSIRVTQRVDRPSGLLNPFEFGNPDTPQSEEQPREFFDRGLGTGFVWDTDGHIVTNHHVVADATDIEVIFANGQTVEAELLGSDPNADLAVIKVDLPASELQPVTLGDSDAVKVGQLTIAIGSPFGQEFTMTSGIVSAVGRTIRSGNALFSIPEAIQTDASINPGNSGGPLLDREGAVIGINSQILSRTGSNTGIGFAVPINTAKQVVPTLIKGEDYEYAWLGISGGTLTPEVAEFMKLPEDTEGALVIDVTQDGPADKAGLVGSDKTLTVAGQEYQLGGDVITAINGQPIKTMDELISYLIQETRPGDTVELQVIHSDGQEETVSVTLGVRPSAEDLVESAREE
ncbi:MAG: trypsin-like peptidase domain-containing protein [Anaerolineae bacterium]|nr:trypsin-like peptidase domain-containing protein [Anaerolineae bacterium]